MSQPGPKPGPNLERVRELLRCGLTNKEIGAEMHLSERAVKWYVGQVLKEAGLYGPGSNRRLIVWLLSQEGRKGE